MTRCFRRSFFLFGAAISLIAGYSDGQNETPSVTKHTVRLDDGRVLNYTAQVGQLPIRPMGSIEPHAYIGYISYRVPPAAGVRRPIIFMWAGGPSGPSLGDNVAYGPKKIVDGKVLDNPLTILSVGDLVFVDPVGTGFSRPAKPEYGAEFYQVLGDQASVAEFIRAWRAMYDPEGSPIFLSGGSYGTWRVSGVAELLEKNGTRVTGAVLRSGGIQLGTDAQPANVTAALRTPGRAVTALYHHLLPADLGTDPDRVASAAEKWAADVYAPALASLASLTDPEREDVARQLSRFTGFPAEKIDRKTLNILPREYLNGMLPGQVLNLNDMRYASPAAGRGGAADGAGGRGGAAGGESERMTAVDYVRRYLGYRTDLAYLPNERGYQTVSAPSYAPPGSVWNYNSTEITPAMMAAAQAGEGPPGTQPWIRNAMTINPKLRVLVAAGLYDSLNSCSANRDMVGRQDSQISSRFTLKCYPSGHVIQADPIAAPMFFSDFRAWVLSTLKQRAEQE